MQRLEDTVRRTLLGVLRQYVKDIQREQLKITVWRGEVFLENMELVLEAFDYLQLPFALKEGRVGKLSIKIPWKKLGWDPIIITLEDVFICASKRDDQEWSLDAVERREFAGKKAKLVAAELGKFSRRVCDNQAGQSFMSYITAKVLDNIQLSIKNFHVLYRDMKGDSVNVMLGARLSSLTIMKQNPVGLSGVRGAQVNKVVEVTGLEIYCSTSQGAYDLVSMDDVGDSKFWGNTNVERNKHDHILAPCDVSVSVWVNKSGKLDDDAPQYSISAELTGLVMSLNEVQLQRILILWDYLSTYPMREKYGRYRPWHSPLSRKSTGWPKIWWHYAQESVLSDVRKKLKRTSWRYLGHRLSYRRKYVNLYKTKLRSLQQEQLVDKTILHELEQMEKESDIDDILNFRSAAECELQEFLSASSITNSEMNGANAIVDKSPNDEQSSRSSRGWWNWLSRGMLGAGGTDDSSQFSGVVSDEVIKDIYEATSFHPLVSSYEDATANERILTCALKFSIDQVSATLRSMSSNQDIAELILNRAVIDCKLREGFASIAVLINSVEMICPHNKKPILCIRRSSTENNVLEYEQSCRVQVDVSPNQEVQLSIKVMLQPLEVTCYTNFFLNFFEFFDVVKSSKFQHERVLASLNGIEDVKTRLLSKAEYILSSHKKVTWDVSVINVIINFPWTNSVSEQCSMVLESKALYIKSESIRCSFASSTEDQSNILKNLSKMISSYDYLMGFQIQDLYDLFDVILDGFEIKILMSRCAKPITVLERFYASINLAYCIIPNESILKQLEVHFGVSSLAANLSPTIYESILELIANLHFLHSRSASLMARNHNLQHITSYKLGTPVFYFSLTANLEFVGFYIDLANDGDDSSAIMLSLHNLDIRYGLMEFEEFLVSMRALKIISYPLKHEMDIRTLCSSGNACAVSSAFQQDMGVRPSNQSNNCNDRSPSAEACFLLRIEAPRSTNFVWHKCTIWLNDINLHCHPCIIGLLIGFYGKISAYGASCNDNSFSYPVHAKPPKTVPNFPFQKFGFSNFFETGSGHENISLDSFPFVTIYNSSALSNLEGSLLYPIPDWRKYFEVRVTESRSPRSIIKNGYKVSALKSTHCMDVFPLPQSCGATDLFAIDLNFNGIRVHFHDSSCTIGTIALSTSKSTLFVLKDSMDMLCSIDGLTLSSSWLPHNPNMFLWGPSLSGLAPVLNIRVRKGNVSSLNSEIEVSIGIQHVCCTLSPEYLAIIIGYFSLPDWKSDSFQQPVTESCEYADKGPGITIIYKFEILDSSLFLLDESNVQRCLKLEVQQLYCSFIPNGTSDNLLEGIPSKYVIPSHKVIGKKQCLNIFGRDLFLSLLLLKDDGCVCSVSDHNTDYGTISLIAPLSADMWIRLPCESEISFESSPPSTCIMTRISHCQVYANDCHFFDGCQTLLDVINHFSPVGDVARCYTSDVMQFLQSKAYPNESSATSPVASGGIFTELRCSVDSLLVDLHCLKNESTSPVAKITTQFTLLGSFRDDTPLSLDFSFSSLALHSLLDCISLAQCAGTCSTSTVFGISLSKSSGDADEFQIFLPSLHIWLHFYDWVDVIHLLNSYSGKLVKTGLLDKSPKNCSMLNADSIEYAAITSAQSSPHNSSISTCVAAEKLKKISKLVVRSEDVGVTFHLPVQVSEEAFSVFRGPEVKEERSLSVSSIKEEKCCKFVEVTLSSRSSELFIIDNNARLKLTLEKVSSKVEICEENIVNSWPFFQILQVDVKAEISRNLTELLHVNVETQCDRFDVWLSDQVFCFWNSVGLNIPEVGSSQPMFSNMDYKIQFRKVSLLLTDGRWSCSGPLLEILMRDFLLCANVNENGMEASVDSDLQVNYNNIDKVVWEPFVEPWKFHLKIIRKFAMIALLNSSITSDIHLVSTAQLNLNFTESLIECACRTIEMVMDAWGLITPNEIPEKKRSSNPLFSEDVCAGRYAPYVLQNLTSLPLVYHVYQGQANFDEFDVSVMNDGKSLDPGSSVPIYLNETPEEQLSRYRPVHSSDKLNEQLNGVAHHFMTIQLDGTSMPSAPISMDLVGITSFEVDFSKVSNKIDSEKVGDATKYNAKNEDNARTNAHSGFVVPVVFDVSVQRYSKLIRLYSTVILLNATSVPLEIRFDIPFGLSPMILDPIYPGQEFPLPLHLAEAGRMRWRPLGNSYLWSEAHNLSNILSQESKIGFLRSFVCYPSHPSSDPFRCCISVQNICLPSSIRTNKVSSLQNSHTLTQPVESCGQMLRDLGKSKKCFIHHVTLSTPLVVNNYLPEAVTLSIDSGGVTHTSSLSEVQTSFHHIDPSHDLVLEFHMRGFKPSLMKFPRTEIFSTVAKCSGSKFSLSETVTFNPDMQNGPVYVSMEKMMDAYSGAREVFVFVPFVLCNCTGFPLIINAANETKESGCILPSCYDLAEYELLHNEKDGLSILSSDQVSYATASHTTSTAKSLSRSRIVSTRKNVNPHSSRFPNRPMMSSGSFNIFPGQLEKYNLESQKACLSSVKDADLVENERQKVKARMYSPNPVSSSSEVTVKLCMCPPDCGTDFVPNSSWSSPFSLLSPSGSANVLVPQLSSNAAFIISVTSNALGGPFAGRTEAIMFQPRYVICNACSKDLCYKQKGTDVVFNLSVGQHSHLHWTDTTRDLLVSIRFHEPGWQWSGSFLPDHLGDTQVKMRNYVSGTLNMVRVEVSNADVSVGDEKIVGNLHGNSGTNLILLSDYDSGYMPYRIDNFSKERLRVYQQRCETFDTIIHPYTSCPYAWDEPFYPHCLSIEVPGERVLGSYTLDEVKEYIPVCVQSTSEKPERTLLLSVHAERATKVLSIIDSSYHVLKDMKNPSVPHLREDGKHELKQNKHVDYREKFSLIIPYVGISLINSYPQELLFVCAKNISIDLLQSVDQQKFSFEISSLQIDNQLRTTPYPVILSFDHECRTNPTNQIKTKDNAGRTKNERIVQTISNSSSGEPAFHAAVAMWRNKDISLVSFEYICLRVADCHLELEQGLILSLFDFLKAVSSRLQSRVLPISDSIINDVSLIPSAHTQAYEYVNDGGHLYSTNVSFNKNQKNSPSLPLVVPIGAPWQQIYLLARRQKKIYVELFDLAPIKLTLSFSSAPWMLRNGVFASGESVIHRGLMALADVEGARIYLKQLTIAHQMASWESIQEILIRHYTRQLLHETYKVFGSAGVIGNPMGFARSLGLGIRDFLSAPARSILQSPTGLITGMAEGTTSLVSNTVYALSDAATQFTKAAHKGIVAFTFDDQVVARMESQQMGVASHSKGLINEVLEGLTGLLQSPIKGAEKHGLPGVLSGIALGITGVVARPAASILEVTGKTAESIRNRSRLYQTGPQRYRIRLPRPLSRELPLRPYSWEEAVGASILVEAHDGVKLKDEVLVMCKALKQAGKYVVITERLILIVSCSSLVNLGRPEFRGVAVDPEWVMESEIGLDSVIHADCDEGVVHIVGSSSDAILRQNQHHSKKGGGGTRTKRWNNIPTPLPLFQTNLELASMEEAECLLRVLLSTIEQGKERGWGSAHLLHQSNIK